MLRRITLLIPARLAHTARFVVGYAFFSIHAFASAETALEHALKPPLPWLTPAFAVSMAGLAGVLVFVALLLYSRARRQTRQLRSMQNVLNGYLTVLDAIPMPVYLRNRELRLMACNTAYAQACGQPRDTLYQSSIEATVRHMDTDTLNAATLERQYREVMATASPVIRNQTVRLRATPAMLQHWVAPLRDMSGAITGVIGGWHDVTMQHRVLQELTEARDRAEAAFRAKSTFLASISHDIRTPMNAILGMLELTLAHGSLATRERQQLETALQAARSLLALIDDLLDLSKMETDKFRLRPRLASLREIVREVADVFSPMANGHGIALDTEVAPSVADAHFVDSLRVKQILNNLVSNAVRFTRQGRVQIKVKASRINEGKQWVQFSIADTGIGIARKALPTLFVPFVQVDTPDTEGGVGLGLSICKRLVDAMNGRIRIKSKPGRGTLVMTRLPLPVALPVLDSMAQAPILIVDDQESSRLLLKHQLQRLGHAVVSAEDGLQALAAADKQIFKLAICDYAMPRMNGIEFVRALRAKKGVNARMPVLAYTAGAQAAIVREALDAGMAAVLLKPVSLDELQAALQAHLPQAHHPACGEASSGS